MIDTSQTGKGNIEKLANITSGLSSYLKRYDELTSTIARHLDEIEILNKSISSLLSSNELIGAKRVAEYDEKVRKSFYDLLNDDSSEILRGLVEDAKLNLEDLTSYYKNHYLQTVARQEEALRNSIF